MGGVDAEEGLTAALGEGDRSACERLVRDQYRPIYNYLWWLSGSRDVASDLTQETFISAWKSLGRFEGRAPVAAWLHSIANRVWKRHLHQRRRDQTVGLDEAAAIPDPSPSPDEAAVVEEMRDQVDTVVWRLPEAYRQVVVLHYFQGLSQREVAMALGIGVGLVKWRINQSLRRLEHILGSAEESQKSKVKSEKSKARTFLVS